LAADCYHKLAAWFSKRTFLTVPRLTVSPQNQARVKDPLLNKSEHLFRAESEHVFQSQTEEIASPDV